MKVALWPVLLLTLLAGVSTLNLRAEEGEVDHKVNPAVDTLPDFNLKDPLGGAHTSAEVAGKKVVILATVPTKEQGDSQKKWVDLIKPLGAGKDFVFILLQDMTQSGNPEMVMDSMKQKWKPGGQVLILVDDRAALRSSLESARGLLTDRTSLLAYDEKGKQVFFDRHAASAGAIKKLQEKLGLK